MHDNVKEMTNKKIYKGGTNCLGDKQGTCCLIDSKKLTNISVEYANGLYHDKTGDPPYVNNQKGCSIVKLETEK